MKPQISDNISVNRILNLLSAKNENRKMLIKSQCVILIGENNMSFLQSVFGGRERKMSEEEAPIFEVLRGSNGAHAASIIHSLLVVEGGPSQTAVNRLMTEFADKLDLAVEKRSGWELLRQYSGRPKEEINEAEKNFKALKESKEQ
jgi:hypothetical protein